MSSNSVSPGIKTIQDAAYPGMQHLAEEKMGDVLVFRADGASGCTRLWSPYSKRTYYTIVDDGSRTNIYKGGGDDLHFGNRSEHLATVTTAVSGEGRLRSAVRSWVEALPRFTNSTNKAEQVDMGPRDIYRTVEKHHLNTSVDVDEKDVRGEPANNAESTATSHKDLTSTRTHANDTRDGIVLITLSDKAMSNIGGSLKVEENSITITYQREVYSLRLGEHGEPSLYALRGSGSQVMWVRPQRKTMDVDSRMMEEWHFENPFVTFCPEVRPFLDAIIIALVVWEKKARTSVVGN